MKTIYLASGILLAGAIGSVYHPATAAPSTQTGAKPGEDKQTQQSYSGWRQALCALSPDPSKAGGDCNPSDIASDSLPLSTAVAFIPDPYMTRLRLQFDRTIEAITWAAQDADYVSFRSHWIPWQVNDPDYSSLPDQKQSEEEQAKLRKQPGVLVFSGTDKNLAVFLVGESPTHAFDADQFRTAVNAAGNWASKSATPLPVIGPCFSGTLAPLAAALRKDWKDRRFAILSGTANSTDAEETFQHDISGLTGSTFHSLFHTQKLRLSAFQDYVERALGASRLLAMLSEDETTFASETASFRRKVDFRFPRGIAYLRNAYQSSPGMLSLSVQNSASPRRSLQLSLEAPKADHDDIPEFSEQTPVSAEAQLQFISEHLHDDPARMALVVATDVLDTLFVAKFLKLSAANTRQVFLDSDLLLGRSGDYPSLAGSLEVSSYPQLTARTQWLPDSNKLTSSSSEWEEGIYRAARASFQGAPDLHPLGANAPDPPLWLTVLGQSQAWPVAVLNDPPPGDSPTSRDPFLPSPGAAVTSIGLPPPTRLWKGLFSLGLLLSLIYLGVFLYAQSPRRSPFAAFAGSSKTYDRSWSDLWLKPHEPAPFARAFYILCLTLALAAAWLTLTAGIVGYRFDATADSAPGAVAALIPSVLLVCLALWLSYRMLTFPTTKAPRIEVLPGWHFVGLMIVAWLLFAGFLFSQFLLLTARGYFKSFFYSYRSIELGSGVSPALPLLFVFLAFACWSMVHLQRRIFAEERYQLLPRNLSTSQIAASIQDLSRQLEENLECTFPRPYKGTFPASLLLLGSAYGIASRHFQSLEGRAYDVYYSAAVAMLVALLFLSTWRFWYCWRQLLLLLEQLALHPIRWALSELPVEYSWSPIWQNSPRKRVYVQLTRTVECLRNWRRLEHRVATFEENNVEGAAAALLQCVAARKRAEPELYDFLQYSLRSLAESSAEELNSSTWLEGSSETLLKQAKDSEQGTLHWPFRQGEKEQRVTLMQEFVALRFVSFIRYAMLQLRNLLTFIMLGFVLLTLSLGCYPFSSPSLLAWTLVGCLVVTGFPIVLAFLEMGRDATLSWISKTKAGEVETRPFLLRVTAFGILPLVSVVAAHFPSIGQYVFSWLQPVIKAIH